MPTEENAPLTGVPMVPSFGGVVPLPFGFGDAPALQFADVARPPTDARCTSNVVVVKFPMGVV